MPINSHRRLGGNLHRKRAGSVSDPFFSLPNDKEGLHGYARLLWSLSTGLSTYYCSFADSHLIVWILCSVCQLEYNKIHKVAFPPLPFRWPWIFARKARDGLNMQWKQTHFTSHFTHYIPVVSSWTRCIKGNTTTKDKIHNEPTRTRQDHVHRSRTFSTCPYSKTVARKYFFVGDITWKTTNHNATLKA